jgi:chemotaxis signal transduction protein
MNSNDLLIRPASIDGAGEFGEAPGDKVPHLVFDVAGQPYACPISQIQHLVRYIDVATLPAPAGVPPWEIGRITMAGEVADIPVVSLRVLWGMASLAEAANGDRQALLIVDLADRPHALLVDGCRCVLSGLPPGRTRFPLSAGLQGARGRAFKLATPWEQSLLVVLELEKLFEGAWGPESRVAPPASQPT